MFTQTDIDQITKHGLTFEKIQLQIENFRKGFPPLNLDSRAEINDGIIEFREEEIEKLVKEYDHLIVDKTLMKFVPASGAASRMFKTLQAFRIKNIEPENQKEEVLKNPSFDSIQNFIFSLEDFAFFSDLQKVILKKGLKTDVLDINEIIDYLLTDKGLNYLNIPKFLLQFHKYPQKNRTSLEEHLVEATLYARSGDGKSRAHFTISKEHIEKFHELIQNTVKEYEQKFTTILEVSHSIQNPSTDTLAVDMDNLPFRNEDGSLVFRPGGHGALIENLNDLDADIIFIKNIDNVVPDRIKESTVTYKKVLAAHLLTLQKQAFTYLETLEKGNCEIEMIKEIENFIKRKLYFRVAPGLKQEEKPQLFFKILNRPMRVCGMVENKGEPGGGPFWVVNTDGSVSLQIVESSQIDTEDAYQESIFYSSTHFNPVDLVCATKDFHGNKFNLHEFIDPQTGFISIKSSNGIDHKALELPGLWNGAMANWTTIFVEVPLSTFNPVKIINDLIRREHL